MRPKLNDNAFREVLLTAAAGALEKAAVSMVGYVKMKLNVSARTGSPAASGRRGGGRMRRAVRFTPSAPGEAPRKRSGWLQRFTAHEITREGRSITARVGNGVGYALHLELGTARMAARPFLRPALAAYLPTFQRVANIELRRRLKNAGS